MRGKYITTSLKLAVLAGSKKAKTENALKGNASMQSFAVIWGKENAAETKRAERDNLLKTHAV